MNQKYLNEIFFNRVQKSTKITLKKIIITNHKSKTIIQNLNQLEKQHKKLNYFNTKNDQDHDFFQLCLLCLLIYKE